MVAETITDCKNRFMNVFVGLHELVYDMSVL
jgi:hypothetical protein